MKFTIGGVLVLGTALALAACGGATDADADGDGTITQEEAEASLASSDFKVTPGQWENTVEFVDIEIDESRLPEEARGMLGPMLNSMKGQVNTSSSCVTQEQADQPAAEMFAGNENADCEYERFQFSGGKIDMAMTCNDPNAGTATIVNTGTFDDDSYQMDMSMQMNAPELGEMKITAKSTGKRVGECTE
jgi:hypothetical protein